MTTTALVALSDLEGELATISTIGEAKTLRDKLEALRLYAKRAGKSLRVQNRVNLAGVLAEHAAGRLLLELQRNQGARTDLELPASVAGSSPYQEAMRENAIADRTARRWERIAAWLNETEIRAAYDKACQDGEEFTRA